jgi:hypothetical protein
MNFFWWGSGTGSELRALHLLSRCSSARALFALVILEMGVLPFVHAGLDS